MNEKEKAEKRAKEAKDQARRQAERDRHAAAVKRDKERRNGKR